MHLSEDETPKVKAPSTNRHWIIAIVSVCMVGSFLALSWSGPGLPHSIYEFIGLQAKHHSDFGLVPHWVELSGFKCPDGFNNDVNGKFSWGGLMSHGRPWYRRVSGNDIYTLFYDSHCADGHEPKFMIGYGTKKKNKWDPSKENSHMSKCAAVSGLHVAQDKKSIKKKVLAGDHFPGSRCASASRAYLGSLVWHEEW